MSLIKDELEKCGLSNIYTVKIASTKGIRLNDECYIHHLYGDMLGFITKDGRLIMMEIPSENGHQNVYCDISVGDFVAAPWGNFYEDSLLDKNLNEAAILVLRKIKKQIKINENLNESFKRP